MLLCYCTKHTQNTQQAFLYARFREENQNKLWISESFYTKQWYTLSLSLQVIKNKNKLWRGTYSVYNISNICSGTNRSSQLEIFCRRDVRQTRRTTDTRVLGRGMFKNKSFFWNSVIQCLRIVNIILPWIISTQVESLLNHKHLLHLSEFLLRSGECPGAIFRTPYYWIRQITPL